MIGEDFIYLLTFLRFTFKININNRLPSGNERSGLIMAKSFEVVLN